MAADCFARFSVWLLCLGLLLSCGATDKTRQNINYKTAEDMINSSSPPLILDVRTPEEFKGELGHIPGARLIPLANLADSLSLLSGYKNTEIIVVCRSGRRSTLASKELSKWGFTKVYNLAGGMLSWKENGGKIK